jgi:hypothetical protein
MQPGKVVRREFEYIRHGTQTLIAAFAVVSGQIGGTVSDNRIEQNYTNFLETVFATGTQTTRWRVVADNLNTYVSESVVHSVADLCGINEDLREGQVWRAGLDGHARDVPARPQPPALLSLHVQARLAAEPDLDLVLHPRAQAAAARWLHLQAGPEGTHRGLHRLFNRTLAKLFKWTMTGKPLGASAAIEIGFVLPRGVLNRVQFGTEGRTLGCAPSYSHGANFPR